jgi:hypothetical protein
MRRVRSTHARVRLGATAALVTTVLWLPGVANAATGGVTPDIGPSTARAVASCGTGAGAAPTITSSPEPCVVTMKVGAVMGITLDHGFTWSDPRASSRAVTVAGIARSAPGGLSATVSAIVAGTATLSSVGTIVCPAGVACPALARLWSMRVIVVVSLTAPRTILATQADSGRHFTLHRGDRLVLRLAGPAIYTWSAPTTSNRAVLRRLSASSGKTASATFRAVAPGTVQLRAVDSPNCYPLCLPPSRLFSLSVTVTG